MDGQSTANREVQVRHHEQRRQNDDINDQDTGQHVVLFRRRPRRPLHGRDSVLPSEREKRRVLAGAPRTTSSWRSG